MGASIPQFFSWGRGASIDQGFPPLPSFLGVIMPNYDITKVRQQLESVEIEVTKKSKPTEKKSKPTDYNEIGNGLGAFGLGWGTKEIIMQSAVASSRGIGIQNVNSISNIRVLGQSGATYMKYTKGIGVAATVLGGAITVADGIENGFKPHHVADLAIQGSIYALSASIPVAGWIVGGAFFLGDLYFQSTHNGQSITQYYLDN